MTTFKDHGHCRAAACKATRVPGPGGRELCACTCRDCMGHGDYTVIVAAMFWRVGDRRGSDVSSELEMLRRCIDHRAGVRDAFLEDDRRWAAVRDLLANRRRAAGNFGFGDLIDECQRTTRGQRDAASLLAALRAEVEATRAGDDERRHNFVRTLLNDVERILGGAR